MLLPYIISTRNHWVSCTLRVFALVNRQDEAELEERKWVTCCVEFPEELCIHLNIPSLTKKDSTKKFCTEIQAIYLSSTYNISVLDLYVIQ